MEIGDKITEQQFKRCEQIEKSVKKFVSEGKQKIYSDADPIRLWVSILKTHKEAINMNQLFMREADSRNGKY